MKELKTGSVNEDTNPWWVGLKTTCGKCKAEWQLEETDKAHPGLQTLIERTPNGKREVTMPCATPKCGSKLVFDARAPQNVQQSGGA